MTNKQELRLWGFISLVGAAVGCIATTDIIWVQLFGVAILYFYGMFLGSGWALRMADKRDSRDTEKAAKLMQKTEGAK